MLYRLRLLASLLIVVFSFSGLTAQKILTIDLNKVESTTNNIASSNYYPSLIKKLRQLDTSLTNKDLHLLYYGQYFQDFYKPDVQDADQKSTFKHIKDKEFDKALDAAKKSFETNPLNLKTIYGYAMACNYLKMKSEYNRIMNLYYQLIEVILESGNGRGVKTAFVVMSIDDEYEIIHSMGKTATKQKLIDNKTDKLKLKNSDGSARITNLKKIYFNVEILLLKADF